ncbi:MAG: hypothetical protein CO156_05355 [Candidatus Pacebacteria bacterium CG_4_9_14_3_um_filter_40_12]|nr:HlyD family efflux transporter periplasmic adaptor subunit [Candidatus Paceibacterota bacterium]PIR63652.1 MAG: hypothetical protein COU64_03590 [Candidatus Pacebacteria bacterium CG10_big_fil_rev_8_21_14_0_10_40_26]PIZ78755.1 MAG: hypothetical protein COY01_03960 [Candidatus Pacebacteria bacterium CG_4_10_14_0_2_um_filter_40_20]PJA68394.1 MAG: hypothetical protein CO156_05355 [Candidatus Pacebacteria bacterium CG_4_9_14_3_um_filter_40_12]PJC41256.1 MAG: hypothetical protein CO041_05425 [Can
MKKVMIKVSSLWKAFLSLSVFKKALLVVVIIAIGLFINSRLNTTEDIAYKTSMVSTGNVADIISETGEISSTSQVSVTSTITGFVTEVYVDNGDQVKRGQKLFYVQSSATSAERAAAYSNYLKAKDSLEAAKSTAYSLESSMWKAHETFEADSLDTDLSVDDPIYIQTDRDWQAAEQKYIDQKAVISQAEASVSSAWLAYQATIDGAVTAPIDGTVANFAVAKGQQVASSQAALLIKSDSETWVTLAISETDIPDIKPGLAATVSIDALDGREIEGTVQRVDEVGTVSSGVVTYTAYISLHDSQNTEVNELSGVLPAMTVQVDIQTKSAENVVVVPNGAIKPYKGGKAVQVVDASSGELLYVPVEVGIVGLTESEILSGVSEGQEIVTSSTSSSSSDKQGGLLNPGR